MEKRIIQLTQHSWALVVPKYWIRKYGLDTNPRPVQLLDIDGGILQLRVQQ